MRIVRKRRRYNPKLSSSTIGKINRREMKIAKLSLRPKTLHRDILIESVNQEIALLIETDEKLHEARIERERDKVRAKLARPRLVDLRTREGRALKARRAVEGHPSAVEALEALRASIRADAADLAPDAPTAIG